MESLEQAKLIFSCCTKATSGSSWGGLEKTVLANKLEMESEK